MIIKKIKLEGFRNYIYQDIDLTNNINLFVGDNAQGKTNIIESVYMCAFFKTYRNKRDIETINFEKDYSRITINYEVENVEKVLEFFLDKEGHKQVKIDDIKQGRISSIIGDIPIVIFSPDDINIIKDAPADRRKFIDLICCQISKSYTIHIKEYEKYLKMKNSLLKQDLNSEQINYLKILNENMSKHIKFIVDFRKRVINELERYGVVIQKELTSGSETLKMKYISDFIDKSEEEILDILNEHINIDIYRKSTVKGVQKDDIEFYINDLMVEKYCSQGQARTVLLTLKLANFEILKVVKKTDPILLLDDIMSELDNNRIKYLFNYINNSQSIITTTDESFIKDFKNVKVRKIVNGSLK